MFNKKTEFKATKLLSTDNIEVIEVSVCENNKAAILALKTKESGNRSVGGNLSVGNQQAGLGGSYKNQEKSNWEIFYNPVALGNLKPLEDYKQEINKEVSSVSGACVSTATAEYKELKPNETLTSLSGARLTSTATGSIIFNLKQQIPSH
jgi:hypothetical protein